LRYLRYVRHRYQYDSLPQFILNGMGFLGLEIHPFCVFFEGIRDGVPPPPMHPLEELEVGFLGAEHMPAITVFPDRKIPERKFLARLELGHLCLGARRYGELVAFTWCSPTEWDYWGRLKLLDHEAYLYDAYTAIPYRGRGIAPALRYRLYEELAKAGKTRLYSISERLNLPSLRFKAKLGAVIIDRGVHVILLKRWHLGRTAASPRHRRPDFLSPKS